MQLLKLLRERMLQNKNLRRHFLKVETFKFLCMLQNITFNVVKINFFVFCCRKNDERY